MDKNSKIYVSGHRGLVGSAIVRLLQKEGYANLLLRTRQELDLMDQRSVSDFFRLEKPEYVFLAAAKVGGIMANSTKPAEFVYENLQIQNNIINAAHQNKVTKLLFLGSSCIYPRLAEQPIKEDSLLTGPLEPTNIGYAIAKISGIIMCQSYRKQYGDDFIAAMPTNIYGLNDNFNPESSHVIPSMIRRFHEAKTAQAPEIVMWGTGSAKREFLHVDDLAAASLFLMNNYESEDIINVGTGEDVSIKELAELISDIVGYEGNIEWDASKPDGMPRKLLDVSKLDQLGWRYTTPLREGLEATYKWYLDNIA